MEDLEKINLLFENYFKINYIKEGLFKNKIKTTTAESKVGQCFEIIISYPRILKTINTDKEDVLIIILNDSDKNRIYKIILSKQNIKNIQKIYFDHYFNIDNNIFISRMFNSCTSTGNVQIIYPKE